MDRQSLNATVAPMLNQLPDRAQHILALYYFEKLHLCEIAQVMGLKESSVSRILSQSLLTLRTNLNKPQIKAA